MIEILNLSDTTLHLYGHWVLNSLHPDSFSGTTAIAYCSHLSGHGGCDVWGRYGCASNLALELILTAYGSARSNLASRNNCTETYTVGSLSLRTSRASTLLLVGC
jgi:hypothetical protein